MDLHRVQDKTVCPPPKTISGSLGPWAGLDARLLHYYWTICLKAEAFLISSYFESHPERKHIAMLGDTYRDDIDFFFLIPSTATTALAPYRLYL